MEVTGTIVTTQEKLVDVETQIADRFQELGIPVEFEHEEVTYVNVKVTAKLNGKKAINHLFNLVKAPDEEIKYLSKIPSVITATLKDIVNQTLRSIK